MLFRAVAACYENEKRFWFVRLWNWDCVLHLSNLLCLLGQNAWVSMYAFVFPCRTCVKFSQQRLAIASSCLLFMYAGIHCIMACLAVGRGSATWPLHQILMYSFSVVSECLFIDEMFAWWTFWSRSTGIPMSLIWMGAGWHATRGFEISVSGSFIMSHPPPRPALLDDGE